MRTKIFVVSLFLLLATVVFTGCGTEKCRFLGEKLRAAERVAKEFLTVKGYQIPRNYEIFYTNEEKTEFAVKKEYFGDRVFCATFNTKGEVISISTEDVKLDFTQILEIQKMAEDFLSTVTYLPNDGYTIEYRGEEFLEITEVQSKLKITFDISKEKIQINDISYTKYEKLEHLDCVMVVTFIICVIVCSCLL